MSIVNYLNNIKLKNFNTSGSSIGYVNTSKPNFNGCSIIIPANTFKNNDVIFLSSGWSAGGFPSYIEYYWQALSGGTSTSIGYFDSYDGGLYHFMRQYHILNSSGLSTGTVGLNSTVNMVSDNIAASSMVPSSYALDWTIDSIIYGTFYGLDELVPPPFAVEMKNAWFKITTM